MPARKARRRPRGRSIVRRVSVRIGCGLSTSPDPRLAAIEAGQEAHAALGGPRADVVCASSPPARTWRRPRRRWRASTRRSRPPRARRLRRRRRGRRRARGRGRDRGRGVGRALGEGRAEAFHLEVTQGATRSRSAAARPGGGDRRRPAPRPLLVPDRRVLRRARAARPGVPVLGGIASARTLDGDAASSSATSSCGDGAVGVAFDGRRGACRASRRARRRSAPS